VEQLDTEVFDGYAGRALPGDREELRRRRQQQSFSPAVLTRTWFHQGPVDPADDGHWQELDWSGIDGSSTQRPGGHRPADEYWSGDPNLLAHTEAVTRFLKTVAPGARRDALRALRGSILRSELYALDGSPLQDRPYTVTEHAYDLREESQPTDSDSTRQRIFFPFRTAQRTTQWERGDDPMTQFSFTNSYDDYGQPLSQTSIAVPRGRDFRVAVASREPYLAMHTVTSYAQRDDGERYIVDRAASATSYQIPNDGSASVFTLRNAIENGDFDIEANLIGQTLNFYDGGAFTGLPLGQLGRFGAVVRTETLVMTRDQLRAAYGDVPRYLVPGAPFQPDAEYPKGFVDYVKSLPDVAGYLYRTATDHNSEGYFAVAASKRYDFHNAAGTGRGLVLAQRDPLGHETTIDYDDYQLLPKQVTGPTGLITKAEYDYRVLQPKRVIDPNGNVTDVAYSPTGLVTQTWVRGKPGRDKGIIKISVESF
jgi:hypothetical protein